MGQVRDKAQALHDGFVAFVTAIEQDNRFLRDTIQEKEKAHREVQENQERSIAELVKANQKLQEQATDLHRKVEAVERRKFTVLVEPDHTSGATRPVKEKSAEAPHQGQNLCHESASVVSSPKEGSIPKPPTQRLPRGQTLSPNYNTPCHYTIGATDALVKRKRDDLNNRSSAEKSNGISFAQATQTPTRPEKQRKTETSTGRQAGTSRITDIEANKGVISATTQPMAGGNIDATQSQRIAVPVPTEVLRPGQSFRDKQRSLNRKSFSIGDNTKQHATASATAEGSSVQNQGPHAAPTASLAESRTVESQNAPWRMTEKQKSDLQDILKNLMKTKNALYFLEPVDCEELEIPQYKEIIEEPMDLGTMHTKLQQNEYESVGYFVYDMCLIVDNACLFNGNGHPVTKSAFLMEEYFRTMMEEFYKANEAQQPKVQQNRRSARNLHKTGDYRKPPCPWRSSSSSSSDSRSNSTSSFTSPSPG